MKKYLPNKAEIAMLIFGFGLGIAITMSLNDTWSWIMLFFWPILFIAMPLLYIINKRTYVAEGTKSKDKKV